MRQPKRVVSLPSRLHHARMPNSPSTNRPPVRPKRQAKTLTELSTSMTGADKLTCKRLLKSIVGGCPLQYFSTVFYTSICPLVIPTNMLSDFPINVDCMATQLIQWRRQRICDACACACAYVAKTRPHLGESGGLFLNYWSLKWHFLHFEHAILVYSVAAPSWIRCLQLVLNWCRQKVSLFHLKNTDEQR